MITSLKKNLSFWILGGLSKLRRIIYQNSPKSTVIIKVDGNTRFHVRKNTSDDYIITEVWNLQEYSDRPDLSIQPSDIIVVVGAQIGVFSILAAKRANQGQVYSFEPYSDSFKLLKKNIVMNKFKNIFPQKMAISDKRGTSYLYLDRLNSGGHSFVPASPGRRRERVRTITLSDIFPLCKIKRIDFMKIDIEGSEYSIIFSTPPKIFSKIKTIVMEYHNHPRFQHNHLDIMNYFKKIGFKVQSDSYFFQHSLLKTGFIIAVNPNL